MNIQYHDYLRNVFCFFNVKLFGDELTECIITLSRHKGANGYYLNNSFGANKHELAVTHSLMTLDNKEMCATFVHEMCHLWQAQCDEPAKNGYHNKMWAWKMQEVGLTPVSIDRPGTMLGFKVTHEIMDGGPFDIRYKEFVNWYGVLLDENKSPVKRVTSTSKTKRPYAQCDCRKMAIPSIDAVLIFCNECGKYMKNFDGYTEVIVKEFG